MSSLVPDEVWWVVSTFLFLFGVLCLRLTLSSFSLFLVFGIFVGIPTVVELLGVVPVVLLCFWLVLPFLFAFYLFFEIKLQSVSQLLSLCREVGAMVLLPFVLLNAEFGFAECVPVVVTLLD
jgi:hypothetical protein